MFLAFLFFGVIEIIEASHIARRYCVIADVVIAVDGFRTDLIDNSVHSSLCLRVLIILHFVKLFELLGRELFYVQVNTADIREHKASVESEGADGIPNFCRHEENCGRLPSSPPTESVSGT